MLRVVGLGSSQQESLQAAGAGVGQSEVAGPSARRLADHDGTMDLTSDMVEPGVAGVWEPLLTHPR